MLSNIKNLDIIIITRYHVYIRFWKRSTYASTCFFIEPFLYSPFSISLLKINFRQENYYKIINEHQWHIILYDI